MELQENLEAKSEEMAKEAARAGKKIFAFVIQGEANFLSGAINLAALLPKTIAEGIGNKQYHGKQTIKQLVGSGAKLEDIPINAENVGDFKATARKYGIDYSLKRSTNGEKPRYIVFFKAKDINVLNAAFKDYSARVVENERKKSIKARIHEDRTAERTQNRERTREKKKDRGDEAL